MQKKTKLSAVPAREAWLYRNPKALQAVRRGIEEAKSGKTRKVKNVVAFLKEL